MMKYRRHRVMKALGAAALAVTIAATPAAYAAESPNYHYDKDQWFDDVAGALWSGSTNGDIVEGKKVIAFTIASHHIGGRSMPIGDMGGRHYDDALGTDANGLYQSEYLWGDPAYVGTYDNPVLKQYKSLSKSIDFILRKDAPAGDYHFYCVDRDDQLIELPVKLDDYKNKDGSESKYFRYNVHVDIPDPARVPGGYRPCYLTTQTDVTKVRENDPLTNNPPMTVGWGFGSPTHVPQLCQADLARDVDPGRSTCYAFTPDYTLPQSKPLTGKDSYDFPLGFNHQEAVEGKNPWRIVYRSDDGKQENVLVAPDQITGTNNYFPNIHLEYDKASGATNTGKIYVEIAGDNVNFKPLYDPALKDKREAETGLFFDYADWAMASTVIPVEFTVGMVVGEGVTSEPLPSFDPEKTPIGTVVGEGVTSEPLPSFDPAKIPADGDKSAAGDQDGTGAKADKKSSATSKDRSLVRTGADAFALLSVAGIICGLGVASVMIARRFSR